MKVLMISLDSSIMTIGTDANIRLSEYKRIVDRLKIIIPGRIKLTKNINEIVTTLSSGGGIKLIRFLKTFWLIKNELQTNNYDLITSQDSYFLGFAAWFWSRVYDVPLEIQIHGFEKLNLIRQFTAGFVLRRANKVRTVSVRTKNFLIKNFKIKAEQIYVLSVSGRSIKIETKNHQKSGKIFLTVGRLVPVKDIALQIKALAKLLPQYPDLKLWIVGDGPEKDSLKKLVLNLNIIDNVVFFDWQENLNKFYNQADFFLLTSKSEGYGRVVVEAASAGLPVIMTDVGLAREFIVNEDNGLVIEIGNLDDLCRAMKRMIVDESLSKRLSLNAIQAFNFLPTAEDVLYHQADEWKKILV